MKKVISYTLYPFLLFSTIFIICASILTDWDMTIVFAWMGGVRFTILIGTEFLYPCKKEWSMTIKSFVRDIKWAIAGIASMFGSKYIFGLIAIKLSENNEGLIANTSIFTGFLITALTYEFFQYWYHRICHEGKGKIGRFLWNTHLAHHLPQKVYLLMHTVFHPLNAFVTFGIIQGTLILMGARQESIFIFNALMGLHGLVSHFNVEIKAGPLNYIFIGTELHRFHHSADLKESKNYGSFLSIWDIVFGTFYYDSKNAPKRLGVHDPAVYPESTQILKVLAVPFWKKYYKS